MQQILRLLTLSMVLAVPLFAADRKAPTSVSFKAKVVLANGEAVAGATASFYSQKESALGPDLQPTQTATSDSDGIIETQIPSESSLSIIRKEGLALSWLSLYNRPGDAVRKVVLTRPASFVGLVVNESDKPVANADVWIGNGTLEERVDESRGNYHWLSGHLARKTFSTHSLSDGRFELTGFPTNARALLAARAPGRVLRQAPVEYYRLESMTPPGPQEIKLTLEPAAVIQGHVQAADTGQPLPGAQISLQPQRAAGLVVPEPLRSGPDGGFLFSEVAAGSYRLHAVIGTNTVPDWVADDVSVSVEAGRTNQDVRITAVRGGFLQVAVFDPDQKPLAEANVNAYREGQGAGAVSSDLGIALLRLSPGEYQVSAYKENYRNENTTATVDNNSTNRVEIHFRPRPKVAGRVTDPTGKPVADLPLTIFPNWLGPSGLAIKTDAQGHFEIPWDPQRFGGNERVCLVVRDLANNLAAAPDLDESTPNLNIQLEPGLVVTGRVEDVEGRPLTNATVSITMWCGNMGSQLGEPTKAGDNGRFRVNCLPSERRYNVNASAPGYGSGYQDVSMGEGETNLVDLSPFVLRVADREIAGRVLDAQEKPAASANVSIQGDGQPYTSIVTDQTGRFSAKVCEGRVRIWANGQNSYASATVDSGDTNVVLQLHSYDTRDRAIAKRISLKGRPLPDLAPLALATNAALASGKILICLFDAEQRPSRRLLKALAEQHEILASKNILVLGAQARLTTIADVEAWRQANPLPFAVGQLTAKTPAGKWVTDIDTLPWLILTDDKRIVVEEGFDLDELQGIIK